MKELKDLKIGDNLTNDDLRSIFKCGPQGGMRKSNETNTLVLVSDQSKNSNNNPYKDEWINGLFHYTGMGLNGDQNVTFRQNKTLANLNKNNTTAYLFEKRAVNSYVFIGKVILGGEIYYEEQSGADGKKREVVKFPLQVIE